MPQPITYPEVYLADKISAILSSMPPVPSAPEKPKQPHEPLIPEKRYSSPGCSIFVMIAVVAIIVFLFASGRGNGKVIICGIVLIAIAWFMYFTGSLDKKEYKKKLEEYHREVSDYPIALSQYQKSLDNYNQEYAKYQQDLEAACSSDSILDYRRHAIEQYLFVSPPAPDVDSCEDGDCVKRGASEQFFYNYLRQNGCCVVQNLKVPVGNTFYYPDIVLEDANGVCFDIEIDEPYAGDDGTPIHYLWEEYGIVSSIDNNRNMYMTEHDWCVVRFSEEQVFLHTQECLQLLLNISEAIISGSGDIVIPKEFEMQKWNKEQASKLAYKRFRTTYVPDAYKSKIDQESYRSYSEIKKMSFLKPPIVN